MDREPKIVGLGISRNELVEVMAVCDRKDVCHYFDISDRTLSRILYDYQLVRPNYGPKRLTKGDAAGVREMYATGNFTQKEVAEKYGLSQSMVCRIINNQAHVTKSAVVLGGEAGVRRGYKHAD